MRLLIDLQGAQNDSRFRGIGRYVLSLARGILRNAGTHDVRLLLSNLFPAQIDPIIDALSDVATRDQFLIFSGVGPTRALDDSCAWRAVVAHKLYEKLVADLNPDALLIGSLFEGGSDDTVTSVSVHPKKYLTAVILYDLIPLLNPNEHISSRGARRWYFGKVEAMRRADLLMGISDSACREGIKLLPSDSDHVVKIGAAAADTFATSRFEDLNGSAVAKEVLAYHGIVRPYIMHTSAFDARKNFEGLVRAFAALPDEVREEHQLVLVCKLNLAGRLILQDCIATAGLTEEEVVLTGFVPDDELRILYANCALFVFPSFHEGFGLPVIEAMWCGAPAIGSNVSSVPEVIGCRDAEFDPNDVDEMSGLIVRALKDKGFRASLLLHAANHARTFSWDAVALRALTAIEAKLECSAHVPHLPAKQEQFGIDAMIAQIAGLEGWPKPSDYDLMSVARALDANRGVDWPVREDVIPRTHIANGL